MFYQNNNDYMRDAFYYSQPQNTYQYSGYMPINNGGMMQPYMNSFASQNSILDMYPQVYKVINPVATRVVSNNSYQYYTEDSLNNMVDTVYNIVEGDVSTLSTSTNKMVGDDTVSQGSTKNTTQASNSKSTMNMEVTVDNNNQLLRDLIKIIIIKDILSRSNTNYNSCNVNTMNSIPQNYYDPRCGMI